MWKQNDDTKANYIQNNYILARKHKIIQSEKQPDLHLFICFELIE